MPSKKIRKGPPGYNFKGENSDRMPAGPGRTGFYTEELGERIINSLWTGECKSLVEVSQQDWSPTRRTIQLWKRKHPEFGAALIEAQEALGEVYIHENQKIIDKMFAGVVEPSAANVAINHNTRVAQSLDPRTYANKSHVQKDERVHIVNEYVNRIDIEGLDEEQLDALENALNAKLLTHGGNSTQQ